MPLPLEGDVKDLDLIAPGVTPAPQGNMRNLVNTAAVSDGLIGHIPLHRVLPSAITADSDDPAGRRSAVQLELVDAVAQRVQWRLSPKAAARSSPSLFGSIP